MPNQDCVVLQVFSREDYMDGEEVTTVIRVTNTRHNVSTHWSLSRFEEKLCQMRDIYQVLAAQGLN